MKFGTKAIHAGIEPDPTTGAIMTPIYQTSTYVQKLPGQHKGYEYSRTHNPTRTVLQNSIAALENGKYGLCFSSGMAAIDTLLKVLKPGDEVISTNDLYGGSYRIFTKVFAGYGIKFHFINMDNVAEIEKYVNENTKLIWIETPTNPLLSIIDIRAAVAIGKKYKALVAVDNTFATPYIQTPLDLGADVVMHSLTKYLAGHSDVVMGALVVNDDALAQRLAFLQNACGATPGPQDCFLVLRGIKTLHLRMKAHNENGFKVAEYLNTNSKVEKVFYPGLPHHKNHDLAKKQMNGFGGMVSFSLNSNTIEDAYDFFGRIKIFSLAESLGGIESMINHPASMTHASIPKEDREKAGLKDTLLRLSVGVEDIEDIIEDLKQAIG